MAKRKSASFDDITQDSRPLSVHKATAGAFFRWGALPLFMVVFFAGIGAIGFFVPAKEGPVVGMSVGIGCSIAAVACLVWSFVSYTKPIKHVELYPGGVIWVQNGQEKGVTWDEIDRFWRTEIRVNGRMSTQQCVIAGGGHRDVVFTFILDRWKKLADTIQHETATRIWPVALEDFEAGEEVSFGARCGISQDGIKIAGKSLSWDQIKRVGLGNGYVVVYPHRGQPLEYALGEMANFVIFLQLLQLTPFANPGPVR